jgi:hypothetical protein
LVGKSEGKRPLGTPRHRWKEKIKTCLRGIGLEAVDWIRLFQDSDRWRTFVNTVMNLRVPQKAGNFLTSSTTISLSRRTPLHESGR